MANSKIQDLTPETTPTTDAVIPMVNDVGGTPVDNSITMQDLSKNVDGSNVPYDNASSGLESDNIQDAIDEVSGIQSNTFEITKDPTGFTAPEDVIITGDSTTRTVTLTGTVNAYYRGEQVAALTSGYTSPAHPNTTTSAYFLLYDGTTIDWVDISTLDADFYENLLIAIAFYNATDGNWVYQRECHGVMQWQSHRELHSVVGTYKSSGGNISDYTLSSTTASKRRPSIDQTTVYDEDLKSVLPALAAEGNYTNFYLSGASGTANFITTATDIVPVTAARPYYNQFTGGSWQQTAMTNNYYMNIWLVAIPMASDTNSQKLRYVWVQGQAEYPVLARARSENPNDVNLGTLTDMTPELVFVGRVIVRYIIGNWYFTQVDSIDGTRYSQTTSPAGNYLSSVSSDATLSGDGTAGDPLTVANDSDYFKKSTDDSDDITEGTTNYFLTADEKTRVLIDNIVTETGTTRTLALTDASKYIRTTNAGAVNITVPPNSSVAFTIGTEIDIEQAGAGTVTITEGSGVTVNAVSSTLAFPAQYTVERLKKVDTDTWTLYPIDTTGGGGGTSINVETLTGNKTLVGGTDEQYQVLKVGSSFYDVILDNSLSVSGSIFIIKNEDLSSATGAITIKDGSSTLTVLYPYSVGYYVFDGSNWKPFYSTSGSVSSDERDITTFGYNAKAGGADSTVYGSLASSNGTASCSFGRAAQSTGLRGVSVGSVSAASGSYTVGIGYSAQTNSQNYSIAKGYYSRANNTGDEERNFSGVTSSPNLAKYVDNGYYTITTDSTQTESFLFNQSSQRYVIQTNSAVNFRIHVIARDDTNNDAASWTIKGCIKRDGSNNTAFVGTPSVTQDFADTAATAWVVAVAADDTNEALTLSVTGTATETIRWAAKLETVEVKF